jgi:hypothetical protein
MLVERTSQKGGLGRLDLVDEVLMAFFVFAHHRPDHRLLSDASVSRIFEFEIAAGFAQRLQLKIHCFSRLYFVHSFEKAPSWSDRIDFRKHESHKIHVA